MGANYTTQALASQENYIGYQDVLTPLREGNWVRSREMPLCNKAKSSADGGYQQEAFDCIAKDEASELNIS